MRIKAVYANEGGWSDWIQPVKHGYKMQCCDCGLVHTMDFRIAEERVQFRAKRGKPKSRAAKKSTEGR